MKYKVLFSVFFFSAALFSDNKFIAHMVTVPLIEGAGGFASIACLTRNSRPHTKAAAAVNLSALGTTVGLGIATLAVKTAKAEKIHRVHKILGLVVLGSAALLSTSVTFDPAVRGTYIAFITYGYTLFSSIPIIIFKF
ncbi:MAG TPA: hypothetical protein DC049_03480 [Spirochaetia bacterium]|nr:hypothetical protein [Spirochaetia bacterium]